MATRCCCPPESWFGVWCRRSASPTEASASSARRCRSARDAAIHERQLHVLERGGARQQVEALEHEADEAVADDGARVVAAKRDVDAVERILPAEGRSRQPMMFIMVLLPEPLVPTIATNSPRAMVSVTSRSARTSTASVT
jgi:hypothetical protein